MSVTAVATPILLISFSKIAALMGTAVIGSAVLSTASANNSQENHNINNFVMTEQKVKSIMQKNHNDLSEETVKEVVDVICQEYETTFVSQDVLTKTLQEHGFDNIQLQNNNVICETELFKLEFYKTADESEPYTLKITSSCDNNEEILTLIEDLSTEYNFNSQNESYNKIKERLEQQGLEIDDEEVFDDDTIVLTVNID